MKKRVPAILLVVVGLWLAAGAVAQPVDIWFGPGGGFNPENRAREIVFPDGRVASASLTQAVLNMIARTETGGRIKICTYSMSDMDTLEALITACRDRNIQVKLLLDASAEWTEAARKKIVDRVCEETKKAREEKRPFDFQIKVVARETMIARGRDKILDDGKHIAGTMHQKFGVFYAPGVAVPLHAFSGSANLSYTSDQIYGENRMTFYNSPVVARQFQEAFARLWNEFGTSVHGTCQSEIFIPVEPAWGAAAVYLNSEPLNENSFVRIDAVLRQIIDSVKKEGGSLDMMMFSLTNPDLARYLVYSASAKPNAVFRILLDASQVDDSDPKESIMGPWMEREAEKLGLKNFLVKYKWKMNAIGKNPDTGVIELVSLRNLFLHHKLLVVNRNQIGLGSYNWSSSGENLNLEDLMVFSRDFPGYAGVIDAVLREFETLWTSPEPEIPATRVRKNEPRSVSGPRGRELLRKTVELLKDPKNWDIVQVMDRGKTASFKDLRERTKLSARELERRLTRLIKAGLLYKGDEKGTPTYFQAD